MHFNSPKSNKNREEGVKKAAISNFYQENEEKNSYTPIDKEFEDFMALELKKIRDELETLRKEQNQEGLNNNETIEKSLKDSRKIVKNEFFQNYETFANYLKAKEKENINYDFFPEKNLMLLLKMRTNEEENLNLVRNLLVVLPKKENLMLLKEEETVVLETNITDVNRSFLGVFKDLYI